MTKVHQIMIRNSKGQLLSIVQADGGGCMASWVIQNLVR
jgi:hypothetical protein